MIPGDEPRGRWSVLQFFSMNPWVGLVGTIASVVGVILAIFFFVAANRHRELTYLVNPTKTVVVKAGEAASLQVTHKGVPLDSDVTAAQVAFWNAGKEPIRDSDMLRPFVISVDALILEVRIRKESREVIGLSLDTEEVAEGRVAVNWSILEEGDGGVVQVIIAGSADTPVEASATVVGQSSVYSVVDYTAYQVSLWVVLLVVVGVAFWFAAFVAMNLRRSSQKARIILAVCGLIWSMLVFLALWFGGSIIEALARSSGPPFGL